MRVIYLWSDDPEALRDLRGVFYRLGLFADAGRADVTGAPGDLFLAVGKVTSPAPWERRAACVPLVILGDVTALPCAPDEAWPAGMSPGEMLRAVLNAIRAKSGVRAEEYRAGLFSDHLMEPCPRLSGEPVRLTHTQRMVLRYLMSRHPEGVAKEELKHFGLRPESELSDANVPTQVAQINRQFFPLLGRRAIENERGRYFLL